MRPAARYVIAAAAAAVLTAGGILAGSSASSRAGTVGAFCSERPVFGTGYFSGFPPSAGYEAEMVSAARNGAQFDLIAGIVCDQLRQLDAGRPVRIPDIRGHTSPRLVLIQTIRRMQRLPGAD